MGTYTNTISWIKGAEGDNLWLKKDKAKFTFSNCWIDSLSYPLRKASNMELRLFPVTVPFTEPCPKMCGTEKQTARRNGTALFQGGPLLVGIDRAQYPPHGPETEYLYFKDNKRDQVLKTSMSPDVAVNWTICYRKRHLRTCWPMFSEKEREKKKRVHAFTRSENTSYFPKQIIYSMSTVSKINTS